MMMMFSLLLMLMVFLLILLLIQLLFSATMILMDFKIDRAGTDGTIGTRWVQPDESSGEKRLAPLSPNC